MAAKTIFNMPATNGWYHDVNALSDGFIVIDSFANRATPFFGNGVTDDFQYSLYVPANWLSGTVTIRVGYNPNATGNAVWNLLYSVLASGAANMQSESLTTATATVAGTISTYTEATFDITLGAASRMLFFTLRRLGADASDTTEGGIFLLSISVEYTSNTGDKKGYIWIPAHNFALNSAHSTTYNTRAIGAGLLTSLHPPVILMPDAASTYVDARVTLPSNFDGGLKMTSVFSNPGAGTGGARIRLDTAPIVVGDTIDPAALITTLFTVTFASAQQLIIDSLRQDPFTALYETPGGGEGTLPPAAGDTLAIRLNRLGSDGADTLAASLEFHGMMVSYDITATDHRNPQRLLLSPIAAAVHRQAAGAYPSFHELTAATNTMRHGVRLVDANTCRTDWIGILPSTYSGSPVLRVTWVPVDSGSGNVVLTILVGQVAIGGTWNPALTTVSSLVAYAVGTQNDLHEFTVDLSSFAFVAGNHIGIAIQRVGADSNDTYAGEIEVSNVMLEFDVARPT